MLYLLHGDDTAASRKYLIELAEGKNVTTLDGKSLKIADFEEATVSGSLFAGEKAVIVEGLLSKNARKKEFITFLNENEPKTLVILWEDKKLPKPTYSNLKKANVRDFFLPSYYFQFLDNFSPNNKKNTFDLYQKLLKNYAPEQLFFSLLKRVRVLVIISSGSTTAEISKMSPWQMNNLQKQLRTWNRQNLVSIYEKLKKTEIRLKTGKLPLGLAKHLDILILSELT